MLNTFAPAIAEVNPTVFTRSGASITAGAIVAYYPERDILDTEAASFAAWQAEEDADADQWSDEFADEMAGLAAAESQIEMGLMAW